MGRRETPFLAPRNAARFNNGKQAHSYLCIHPQCKPAILLYFCTHMYSSTVRSPRMPKCSRARMKGEILQTLRSHHPSGGCSSRVYLPTQPVLRYLFVVQYCKIFKQSVSFHSSSFKVFVCCVVLYNIQAEGVWCSDCPHSSPCTPARRKCCKLEPKPRQA